MRFLPSVEMTHNAYLIALNGYLLRHYAFPGPGPNLSKSRGLEFELFNCSHSNYGEFATINPVEFDGFKT
jgi:hypothetical protein